MCLAVPGKVVSVGREHDIAMGKVDFGGVLRQVCLEHVDAAPGDWVLVHVGYALSKIDEGEAQALFALLRELGEADGADP
jgi:hydrogenase expression/formation protein HypC